MSLDTASFQNLRPFDGTTGLDEESPATSRPGSARKQRPAKQYIPTSDPVAVR